MDRRRFTTGLLVTAALQRHAWADDRVTHDTRALMGTRVRLSVEHADAAVRTRALMAAWASMQWLADTMSRFRDNGVPARLAARAGEPDAVPVSPAVMAVLQAAARVSATSHGAFDITVGAYDGWHFDGRAPARPDKARLRAQRHLVDHRDVVLDPAAMTARLRRAGMRIDLGGIAKLPILEAGLQAIRSQGVRHAMVDGGGDVLCCGRLRGHPWRVGVRDPLAPQRLVGVVELGDDSDGGVVASSGDYERAFFIEGQRWHHVLAPDSGEPARGLRGVALVAADVAQVNGLGAAMMVAGATRAREWLHQRPGVDALLAGDDGTWQSRGMRARWV